MKEVCLWPLGSLCTVCVRLFVCSLLVFIICCTCVSVYVPASMSDHVLPVCSSIHFM